MSVSVKIATVADCERVQPVFNHKAVIEGLGGFTMLDQLKACCQKGKAALWYAEKDGQVVGGMMCASRPMSFQMKYGSVGVIPEYRRQRISTAMYTTMTLQGIMEGRRLFEDTIVGDNPFQFAALPTFGLNKVGYLRHKTGSGKDICLFDFSLLTDSIDAMLDRIPDDFQLNVVKNWYTKEVLEVNLSVYEKKLPGFATKILDLQKKIEQDPRVVVYNDTSEHPTDARRAKKETKHVNLFSDE
jgi:hypothetical protein